MITYHFGTKDELWREAVRDMFALIEQQVTAEDIYEADLDPVERFRRQMRRYTRYCAQHPEHARITIAETIRGGPRLQWMIETFVKQNHAGFTPQLHALMEAGCCPRCSRNRCITPLSAWRSCPLCWPMRRRAPLAMTSPTSRRSTAMPMPFWRFCCDRTKAEQGRLTKSSDWMISVDKT
jgi:AcrR family transcriptional regulator